MTGTDVHADETAAFARLGALLEMLKGGDTAWAGLLHGVDPSAVTSRGALAGLPVLRKSDLVERQKDCAPFGGLNITPPERMARLFASPGPIFEAEGLGDNWWGAEEALRAAGVQRGDVVINTFSYHLTPAAFLFDSGARAIGCAVIPAGPALSADLLGAIGQYQPGVYVGIPDFLNIILEKLEAAGLPHPFKRAIVSGAALPPSLAASFKERGIAVYQTYGTAELGVIAYEDGDEGMRVQPEIILEIVRPGSGDPVPEGEIGEVLVTRINPDYPLIRFATGDLSSVLPGATGLRISGWKGRADQATKVKGLFVRLEQINALSREFPDAGRMRLVVTRENERDSMRLLVEHTDSDLAERVEEQLAAITKLRGSVQVVRPGSLPADGKVISDER